MSMRYVCVAATAAGLLSAAALGQFNNGNLVLLQVTHGTSGAATANGAPISLVGYQPGSGFTGFSANVPNTTAGSRMVLPGNSTSEGQLTLSADGRYLVFGGYDTALGTSGITTSTTIPRAVGRASMAGAVDVYDTDAYAGNNFRGGYSNDGSAFFLVASNGGVRSMNAPGPVTAPASTGSPTNLRVLNAFDFGGGQRYFVSTGSALGGWIGIGEFNTVTGLIAPLPGMPTATGPSAYDFVFNAAGTTLWVADDRSTASGGGLQRWDLNAGTWGLTYTMTTGLPVGTAGGLRGLTLDPATGTLFATTAGTSTSAGTALYSVVDTGAGSTFSLLATAPTGAVWRGVEFVPTPGAGALLGCGLLAASRRRRV